MSSRAISLLLGKCVPCVKPNASKFCVSTMELDENLLMYFRKVSYIYAIDPEKKCKTGDIVLIEELPQKLTKLITHKVSEIIYPLGDVVDPLTGKKVVVADYREDIEEKKKLYGENRDAFQYEKAPPRGWQEGVKDFTDKDTYYKYHEDNTEQPYAL
uniref:Putative mitochondrial ribosomal protein s17 rhodnius neglectus n=2 Tax=Rhodnius TaxID=13248 RepID=A0A4P6D9Q5_RHOPR